MEYVLLNSGGLDSLAVAIMYHKKGDILHSLYIDIGITTAEAAGESAKRIADMYCASHNTIKLSSDTNLIFNAPSGKPIVKYQAMLWHMLGAMYANKIGVKDILSGNKGKTLHPDFESKMQDMQALVINSTNEVFHRPLLNIFDLNQIYQIVKFSPLTTSTVSCAVSYPPCGVCNKCKQRQLVGIDPKPTINTITTSAVSAN